MKFNVRIFFHGYLQRVWRLSQKHISTILVLSQIQGLSGLEIFQLLLVATGDPRRLVQGDGFVTARGVVLMQQTVLNHLKLQLANRSDDLPAGHLTRE